VDANSPSECAGRKREKKKREGDTYIRGGRVKGKITGNKPLLAGLVLEILHVVDEDAVLVFLPGEEA